MTFEVVRKKTGEVYTVYSTQMMVMPNALGQPVPAAMFLIYDKENSRWELADVGEFVPVGVEVKEKVPVTGKDSIILTK